MAILQNAKHEKFAQGVAKGKTAEKSYLAAGYAKKGAAQGASRLLKNVKVRARIEVLGEKITHAVVVDAVVDKSYVIGVLKEITERCLQHRPVMRDGKPLTTKGKKGESHALYTFNAQGATRSVQLLGMELGLFRDAPRLPPGMEPLPGEGGHVTNNTQINVLQAFGEGGLRAVRSFIAEFKGQPRVAAMPRTSPE